MGLLSNTKWVAFSQLFKVAVQLLNIVVLARFIPPSEYGLMAMALVVTNLAALVRDLGTAAAIIQRKDLQTRTINAIFWLNVIMGISIAGIIIIISPIVASIFHEQRLILVLCLLSISFPLASTASAHLALMEKKSRFKDVAYIEISSSVVSVIIAIVLAYAGWGVYSLVAQSIILALMSTIQIWGKSNWRPTYSKIIDLSEIKGLLGFSGNLTIFNFINYFSRNADSIIIGHFLSAAVLGAYSLAYRVMLFPLQSLTFVATRALYPIFSEHQDNNEKLKKSYLNTLFVILLFVFPIMVGLAVLRDPFVRLVFGEKWILTASILLWLAPTGIIQTMLSTSGTIFMAKGRTDILMKLGFLGMFLQVTAFILGVQYGVLSVAKFYFIANVINFFPVMWSVMKLVKGNLVDLFKKIHSIFIGAIFLFIVLHLSINNITLFNPIDGFAKLALISSIGALSYGGIMILINKDIFVMIKNILIKRMVK